MLKRLLALFTAMSLLLCGCGSKVSPEEVNAQIDEAYKNVMVAKVYNDDVISIIYDNWNYNGFEYYFYEDALKEKLGYKYTTMSKGDGYWEAKLAHDGRAEIYNFMNTAKESLNIDSIPEECKDYYDAVKALYLKVDSYVKFGAEFPEGYSKLTYGQTFVEYQNEYDALESEVEFAR